MNLRRFILVFWGVVFATLLFPLLGFAQEEKIATPPAQPKKVEYTLPYPGILPDNPLYGLKMLRDRVVAWFINDPLKKAEYDLLQADKRLNSGLFLIEQGKATLAESTFTEGERYMEEALNEAEKAQKAGKDINPLMSKLSLAALKHQEVLQEVLEKSPESAKKGLKEALDKSQKSIERVRSVQKKKLEKRIQERLARREFSPISAEAKEKENGR